MQSLKLLEKVKELTKNNNQVTYLQQILFLEKKIETLHITRSLQNRAEQLSTEVADVNERVHLIGELSNISLQLYSWYIKNGHARNAEDREAVDMFLQNEKLARDSKLGLWEACKK